MSKRRDRLTERHLIAWLDSSNDEIIHQAESLPLRRDMDTLLRFVRDNKIVGTQSTGNMPLKAVREVTVRFVKPPRLDEVIGGHTYRLRSEMDVWPLYFLHNLAEVAALLQAAPARRWRLTHRGQEFLDMPPLLQLAYLLTIWWYKINWLVAYPFMGMGDSLPLYFNLDVLESLRALPVTTRISFEEFADELIEKTGLTWTAQNLDSATMLLHGSIKRMVIDILANFGSVEREFRDKPLGKGTIPELVAFEITPLGDKLLKALAITGGVRQI